MEAFDQAGSEFSASVRPTTTIAPQALMLLNSTFMDEQSVAFAERLERDSGSDTSAQIQQAYRLAIGRAPREDELATIRQFHARQLAAWTTAEKSKKSASHKALVAVCKLILNLNEFAYID
jgi:hypothetical protein